MSKLGSTIESSEITDATIAAADISADALDFTELKDSMSLDAATTIALGANNFNINLSGTGTFNVQDGGTTVLSVLDDGTFLYKSSANNSNAFRVEESGGLDFFRVDTQDNAVRVGDITDDSTDILLVLDGASSDPLTGINGGSYYNTTSGKFRCYEGDAWKNCISTGYSINVLALSSTATANKTSYFGNIPRALSTTADASKIYISQAGAIKKSSISVYCVTAGTALAWPLYVRVNGTTDTLIDSVTTVTTVGTIGQRIYTNNALNIAVAAGDYIEIKSVTPGFTTAPSGCTFGGYVYIE